jgi:hypothetical protein
MSLWGNLDAANNAPKSGATAGVGGTPQVTSNTQVYYANTKASSFVIGTAVGVFGVDASEQATSATDTGLTGHPQHAGWVMRKTGMGAIATITANSGAVGVNSSITFAGGQGKDGSGATSAAATISVNTAGYITTITVSNPGLYANTPVATPNTGNAVFTVTMGGRANRVSTETLVAMGSMTGDGDTLF